MRRRQLEKKRWNTYKVKEIHNFADDEMESMTTLVNTTTQLLPMDGTCAVMGVPTATGQEEF